MHARKSGRTICAGMRPSQYGANEPFTGHILRFIGSVREPKTAIQCHCQTASPASPVSAKAIWKSSSATKRFTLKRPVYVQFVARNKSVEPEPGCRPAGNKFPL